MEKSLLQKDCDDSGSSTSAFYSDRSTAYLESSGNDTDSIRSRSSEYSQEIGAKSVPAQRIYTVSRVKSLFPSSSGDYSGIFYSNSFKVDRPIHLLSVGFYGPAESNEAIYNVEIQLEVLRQSFGRQNILANAKRNLKANKGEIFYVGFPSGVTIESNKWYTIKFQLDGPRTLRGDTKNPGPQNVDGKVIIEFFKGSHQMPLICFTLV